MDRRRFLEVAAAGAAMPLVAGSQLPALITRPIYSTGERVPIVGMGTWQTFDVGRSEQSRNVLLGVLETFFNRGGKLIDSSPMYGSSEPVVGDLLGRLRPRRSVFSATKVWIPGKRLGVMQMESSRKLWGVTRFDLMQVHNLLDWEAHLDTLKEMKSSGGLRYIGVTTSHGRRHDELERIMKSQPLDFVQFTYNLADRSAEDRLLPLARERKIAVIINRPLDGGDLFQRVRGTQLPAWAGEVDCTTWSQFFLKFVVSHPAITCAIPATSQRSHMQENMAVVTGRLPDEALRRRMADHFARL
ncbi:MAG TPA: aldo/keto reductase [Gemmatimonadaceae bacterium]|nr:aldo/keto reductase [Gemmatimonadaceae bacterium]